MSKNKKIKKKNLSKNSLLDLLYKSSTILKNKTVGLAVSGGIDSMVMLDLFHSASKELNLKLFVLHFNHNWRKSSKKDLKLIQDYCTTKGIILLHSEAKGKIKKDEEIARNERYLFFKSSSEKYSLDIICTAHHMNDQAETILFRLARGTGPLGLMPIKDISNFTKTSKLFRPFLHTEKSELLSYAKERKIDYLFDKTNLDKKYKRNLIRLKILPKFEEINKNAQKNLITCCELIYSQHLILDKYFLNLQKKLSVDSKQDSLVLQRLNRKAFTSLDIVDRKAFIYWLFSKLGLSGSISKINNITSSIANKKRLELTKEIVLKTNENLISIEKNLNKNNLEPSGIHLKFTVNTTVRNLELNENEVFHLIPYKDKLFSKAFKKDKYKFSYVDLSKYKNKELIIRNREAKDIFQPVGFHKTIRLKNYLINKKIPLNERYNLSLLCHKNEILWIPGYSLSDKIKVKYLPTHILRIKKNSEKEKS